MAMMAKMRSLAPAFIITVGALFVLFMVISDSNVLEAIGGRTNNVGSINGVDITYQEYQFAIEQQREQTKQQTGEDIPEEQWDQFRDQVWDAVVTQQLLAQEIEKLGVTVSDEEIRDAILGDDPPAFLKQNFIDSLGNFNRELYENAIFDPQNEPVLLQAEEFVRQQRLNEKLQSMLLASITVGENEVERKFLEQNIYMNAKYVLFENAFFPDSLITITDEDLRDYYDNNLDRFRINAQRKIRYVLFRNQPSEADTNLVIKNLTNVKEIVVSDTASFKSFVDIYSDVPYSIDTLDVRAFSTEALEIITNAKKGSILGPVPSTQGYTIYHLVDVVKSSEKSVRASHILINDEGDDEKNLAEANRIYQELIGGADFAELAIEHSNDPGSGSRGGDLGWFSKGAMVKEFEEAVFSGKVDEVQKPVKTTFGYHVIKVTGQSNKKYVVEKILNQVKQSAATRDATFNAASDFAYLADKNGFDKEAELVNYEIKETSRFTLNSPSIPGLGSNRMLVNFAFENSLNDISDVFKVQTGFVVAQISEIVAEGHTKFEDLGPSLRQLVATDKKYKSSKALADDLINRVNGNIDQITVLDPRIIVKTTGRFNSQTSIPGIGTEHSFTNTALNLDKNQLSEPFKGLRGYYVINLTEKTEFDSSSYSLQSSTIRNNLIQEKKNTYLNLWLTKLKENADIVDNRYIFYQF